VSVSSKKVIDVYRCYNCKHLITSKTLTKLGVCRFCGSNCVQGTHLTLLQTLLVKLGVIR